MGPTQKLQDKTANSEWYIKWSEDGANCKLYSSYKKIWGGKQGERTGVVGKEGIQEGKKATNPTMPMLQG